MKSTSHSWLAVTLVAAAVVAAAVVSAPAADAAVPQTMSYQGMLRDSGGDIVPDDLYALTFRLYDVASGGTPLWAENDTVQVTDGIFSTVLGTGTPLDLAFDRIYWLSIAVGGGAELSPRAELAASPYAFRAALAESLVGGGTGGDSDWQYSGDNIYRLTGNVGVGSSTPTARLEVSSSATSGIRSTTNGVSGQAAVIAITSTNGCQAIDATANCDGFAVRGSSLNYIGVGGFSSSRSAFATYGRNLGGKTLGYLGGGAYGVYGQVDSLTQYAAWGVNTASGSRGSIGSALYGIYGSGPTGVYGYSTQFEGVSGYTSGAGSKGVYGEHSSGNYGWLGDDTYGVYGSSAAGYAGYFSGKAKVTSNIEVGNMARILGTTWPSTGASMELAYDPALHRGYIQVYNRNTGTGGDLYIGYTNVGFRISTPARPVHIKDVMRLEPRSAYPTDPADGDLCIIGASGSRHICCYLNGAWKQLD